MSTLENTHNYDAAPIAPAEQAGVFFDGAVSQPYEVPERIFEAQAKLASLQRAGRLMGQRAVPGQVVIYAIPDEQGKF